MQGRIIKGVGGFYEVLLQDRSVVTCKARGRFRNEHIVPMVGDLVEISRPERALLPLTICCPERTRCFALPFPISISSLSLFPQASRNRIGF